jgi:hypothetical protein
MKQAGKKVAEVQYMTRTFNKPCKQDLPILAPIAGPAVAAVCSFIDAVKSPSPSPLPSQFWLS